MVSKALCCALLLAVISSCCAQTNDIETTNEGYFSGLLSNVSQLSEMDWQGMLRSIVENIMQYFVAPSSKVGNARSFETDLIVNYVEQVIDTIFTSPESGEAEGRTSKHVLPESVHRILGTNPYLSENKKLKSWVYMLWMITYSISCTLFGVLCVTLLPDPETLGLIRAAQRDDMASMAQSNNPSYQFQAPMKDTYKGEQNRPAMTDMYLSPSNGNKTDKVKNGHGNMYRVPNGEDGMALQNTASYQRYPAHGVSYGNYSNAPGSDADTESDASYGSVGYLLGKFGFKNEPTGGYSIKNPRPIPLPEFDFDYSGENYYDKFLGYYNKLKDYFAEKYSTGSQEEEDLLDKEHYMYVPFMSSEDTEQHKQHYQMHNHQHQPQMQDQRYRQPQMQDQRYRQPQMQDQQQHHHMQDQRHRQPLMQDQQQQYHHMQDQRHRHPQMQDQQQPPTSSYSSYRGELRPAKMTGSPGSGIQANSLDA